MIRIKNRHHPLAVSRLLPLALAMGALISPLLVSLSWAQGGPAEDHPPANRVVLDYNAKDQTLSIHTIAPLPLTQLLSLLTEETGIRFRLNSLAQEKAKQPVAHSFDRLPMERAISRLLGHANTAMIYTGQPGPSGRTRPVLAEVHIVALGDQIEPIIATPVRTTGPTGGPLTSLPGQQAYANERLALRQEAAQQALRERIEAKRERKFKNRNEQKQEEDEETEPIIESKDDTEKTPPRSTDRNRRQGGRERN